MESGLRLGADMVVSPMAWGMWRLRGGDAKAARVLMETALESGITLFDTADVYGPDNGEPFGAAEALLGQVFAETPHLRDRMVLASKGGIRHGWPYNSSADYLVEACEASLKRLNVERLDLYQVHRPDDLTHPSETAEALFRLRGAGKIREVGVSNHSPGRLTALQAHLPFALVSVQPELSLLQVTPLYDGVLDQAMEKGLAVMAWSPLGGGRLMGPEARPEVAALLTRLAGEAGASPAALACAWIMQHPARPIPIIGSQRPERIRAMAAAVDLSLSRSDWYALLAAARGAPLP